jgi:protein-tyrosine phosphatase
MGASGWMMRNVLFSNSFFSTFSPNCGIFVVTTLVTQKHFTMFELFSFFIGYQILAMSPMPGLQNLDDDIAAILEHNIEVVVCLVTEEELAKHQLTHYFDALNEKGLTVHHFPIADYGVPDKESLDSLLHFIHNNLNNDKNVLVHCMGGLGRSGTVVGCYANKFLDVEDPIRYVRDVRGEAAIETEAQEKLVEECE